MQLLEDGTRAHCIALHSSLILYLVLGEVRDGGFILLLELILHVLEDLVEILSMLLHTYKSTNETASQQNSGLP